MQRRIQEPASGVDLGTGRQKSLRNRAAIVPGCRVQRAVAGRRFGVDHSAPIEQVTGYDFIVPFRRAEKHLVP